MERKWIASAFVDLRGFGTWIYRASIPREIKEPFIEDYLQIVQKYLKRNTGHFKYLGDGFLSIKEFTEEEKKHGVAMIDFVKGLKCVTRKIIKLLNGCDQPPDGVRVRITAGYAYKTMVIDPNDSLQTKLIPEYIEYGINTAERLMEVNPEIICLATKDFVDALGKQRSVFRCRPLKNPSCFPKGLNIEDLQTLVVLKF